jgi:intein/homing endonuclease
MEKQVFDTFSKHHNKIHLEKIVGKYHPILPVEGKVDDNRLTNAHVRKQNFKVFDLFSGEYTTRDNPLPEEFKSILELSTRGPLCPCPFVLDTMMGVCLDGDSHILLDDLTTKIPIRNIRVGDYITGHKEDGIYVSEVSKVINKGTKDTLKIRTKTGKKLICTPDHKIYTKRGWIEARNLTTKDEVLTFE